MNNSLKDTVKELREMFPALSDIELAQLALSNSQQKTKSGVTTGTLILMLLLKKSESNQIFLLKNKFLEAPDLLNQNSRTSLSPIFSFLLLGCQAT